MHFWVVWLQQKVEMALDSPEETRYLPTLTHIHQPKTQTQCGRWKKKERLKTLKHVLHTQTHTRIQLEAPHTCRLGSALLPSEDERRRAKTGRREVKREEINREREKSTGQRRRADKEEKEERA